MALSAINSNTYQAIGPIYLLSECDIAIVKKAAFNSQLQRARINIHTSDDDVIHEMIIAFTHQSRVSPHRHPGKIESFNLLEGAVEIRFYDDNGSITKSIFMKEQTGPRYYRLQTSLWHSVHPLSSIVLLHEITSGPFRPGISSETPEWYSYS